MSHDCHCAISAHATPAQADLILDLSARSGKLLHFVSHQMAAWRQTTVREGPSVISGGHDSHSPDVSVLFYVFEVAHMPMPFGTRIVVADDNRDAAESLAMLLSLMGNEVRTAFDGQQAVELVEECRPDIVMLDIGMPRLNGHEAARRIREHEWGKDLMLVAVTALGLDEDRHRSYEAGFNVHLVKPVDLVVLGDVLASWAAHRKIR